MNNYIVYLLINSCNSKTYVGITNNFKRRIRQHNNEIKGGARYTKCFKGNGEWTLYLYIPNLSKSIALSIERKIKHMRHKSIGKTPLIKRINSIEKVLLNTEYNYILNK